MYVQDYKLKTLNWDKKKNEVLKKEKNISFEEVILNIEMGNLLDVLIHPNPKKYPNQKIFVVKMKNYTYCVPFVENENEVFLKTIFPSRKLHKKYKDKE